MTTKPDPKGLLAWSDDLSSAPYACSVMAARFDNDCGEWIYGIVLSPPIYPFTHWRECPAPPDAPEPVAVPMDEGAVERFKCDIGDAIREQENPVKQGDDYATGFNNGLRLARDVVFKLLDRPSEPIDLCPYAEEIPLGPERDAAMRGDEEVVGADLTAENLRHNAGLLRDFWADDIGTSLHLHCADLLDTAAIGYCDLVLERDGLREALEQVASCDSHHPQDVVAIARAALSGLGERR